MTHRTSNLSDSLGSKKLILALLAAGVLGGVGATAFNRIDLSEPARAQTVQPALAAPAAPAQTLPSFAAITRENGAAVVNISVRGMRKVSDTAGDDDEAAPARDNELQGLPPQLREFMRQFGMPGMPGLGGGRGGAAEVPVAGEGSGFIVSHDGLILTNAHVVRGASDVNVKLTDRREFKAKVLGSDTKTDIAVLKIEAKDLPVVKLGSSQDLQVGEWVLAIGSPFGFENSVTAGVVSAKGRSLPDESYVPFLQTDVAVNPGNSGGPLFNARGEVVGINSQIYSRSGGYQGLSFAIPIEVASQVKDQIVKTGKVEHARLGVTVQEVNQALADSFNLPKPEGALVANVEAGSPAEKAGLKSGDVITRYNGQPIVASGDLPALVGMGMPGTQAKLDVIRQGKSESLNVTLGGAQAKGSATAQADGASQGKLGLALRDLTPQEQQAAGTAGLVVQQVSGPAAMAGVQPGDVLVSVNGKGVRSVDQVRDIVAGSPKSVALLISRDGQQIFVPVRLG
ncbi:peptidase [Comamonas serinivorans]|uniref:Probable periplasmic serine endoprotease DegP-like n=1 Tax=Comamonas serinivorans TaxID=1082851 RepID=A0A1Y0ELZ4_9BURK|nr:Do family serine endopeptidase [Comamonas serinivorans]ARU04606.1 peptidase [Comamonas serinivorans]